MNNHLHKIVFITLLCLVLAVSIHAQEVNCTHYVAPGGDDANPGTQEQPWSSLENAAEIAQAGDTVCVGAGTYVLDGGVTFATSGTADQPITFTTYNGAVMVQGEMTLSAGVSHLRLHGFTLRDFPIWGITLDGGNQDIVLSGLDVGGGEAGIHFTYGDSGEAPGDGPVENITLSDSVIHDSLYTAVDCTPGPCNNMRFQRLEIYGAGLVDGGNFGADGLAIERGHPVLVEDCYVHDNGGDGIDLNSRDVGDEISGIIVQRNRVTNNLRNGLKLWNSGLAANNLVWNSGEENLVLVEGSSYTIVNNTFANRASYGYLALIGDEAISAPTNVSLYNNIFYNDNPEMGGTLISVSAGTQLDANHNLYFNPYREEDVVCGETLDGGSDACFNHDHFNDGTWFGRTGQGEHSTYADPLFVDASNGNFHLTVNSPAVDAGIVDPAPDDDLEENSRPSGDAPDMGAYEYGTGGE